MLNRILAIIFNPSSLAERERRPWLDVVALTLIIAIAAAVVHAPLAHKEGLKFLEKTRPERVEKLKQMGAWEKILKTPDRVLRIRTGVTIALTYLFGLFFSSVLLYLIVKFFATGGTFIDMLYIYAHSTFISYGLAYPVRALLIHFKKTTIGISTSITLFLPSLSPYSSPKLYYALQNIDLFDIWAALAAGYAIAALLKIKPSQGIAASLIVWAIKVTFLIGISFLF